jgi:enoyl-[acyl-carrier protein] reductase II
MIETRITRALGIRHPIFQGGMAWAGTARLAAAVSEAGGLGIIGAGAMPPDLLRREIQKVRSLTPKPFGVNLYYLSPFFSGVLEVILEERVPVVTTGAGNPGKEIERFKKAGTRVFPVVSSVALAKRLERIGVDGLIAEGMEAGGHIGEIGTIALVPEVAEAVAIPVLAAGGIADGRGLAAALSLGAEGVQLGTRFLCSRECEAHENYKEAVLKARDRSTVVTGTSTGHPVRVIENRLAKKFLELERGGAGKDELEKLGEDSLRKAVCEGDTDWGSLMAGQSSGLIREIKSVKEIIESIVTEAESILRKLPERIV